MLVRATEYLYPNGCDIVCRHHFGASVQTAERYIGCRQKFKEAVNNRFQILLANTA